MSNYHVEVRPAGALARLLLVALPLDAVLVGLAYLLKTIL